MLSPEERRLLNEPARGLSEILQYSCGFELLFEPPIRIGEKDWLALLGIEAEVRGIVRAFEDSHMDAVSAERRLLDVVRRIRAGA